MNRLTHTTMASGRDVGWLLDARAARRGEHPFLVWEPFVGERRTWSYREVAHRTRQLAAGLQRRGLVGGDRVLLHLENTPEFLLAWFACARIGVVPVCTNTKSVQAELAYFAEHSGAVAAVTQQPFVALVQAAAPGMRWIAVVPSDAGSDGRERAPGSDTFDALYGDADDLASRSPDAWAPASVQYTSGTTSRPKAVVWTHANCLWAAKVSAAHEALLADDVHLVHLPLFHTNAQSYSVLASLWAGATIVLQPKFSASRFWEVSLRNRCTWTSMVPFCNRALAEREVPKRHDYRYWGSGIRSRRDDDRFKVHTIAWWGMTETVTHGIVDDPADPGAALSCGRPAPEYDIRVRRENGRAVEPGETGALFVRGVRGLSLFGGYLHDDAATAAAIDSDGWLDTGDQVTVNLDGSISFADRIKDVLKVGGENVSAAEVEAACRVPGVREVAVVGGPHPMLGEVPVVFVVPSEAGVSVADDVLAACRQRLAPFKVPHAVHLIDELPRSTMDKIAKAELRQLLSGSFADARPQGDAPLPFPSSRD